LLGESCERRQGLTTHVRHDVGAAGEPKRGESSEAPQLPQHRVGQLEKWLRWEPGQRKWKGP